MTDDKFREALEAANAEYRKLQGELAGLRCQLEEKESRRNDLREYIIATSKMLKIDYSFDGEELGLTDAVRQAFKNAQAAISPVGVEKYFAKIGYDLSRYGSPASATASINKIVARLLSKGEIVETGKNQEGRTVYRWAGNKRHPIYG